MKISKTLWLYCLCFSVYALLKSSSLLAIDGICRYRLTESLFQKGAFAPECIFAPAQSLLQIPLYLLGGIAEAVPLLPDGESPREFLVGCFNTVIAPLCVAIFFRIGLLLGYREKTALRLALLLAFGTALMHYARFNSNEPLLCLLLTGLFFFILRREKGEGWGNLVGIGSCLALLLLDNYIMPPLILITLVLLVAGRDRMRLKAGQVVALVSAAALALIYILYYNHVRYGSIWMTGYHRQRFSTPLLIGLSGLLLSPESSLFLYNPVLILSLFFFRRFLRSRKSVWVWHFALGVPLYFLLVYSLWQDWHGGAVWGPRYLVPILPFLILPLGEMLETYPRWGRPKKALIAAVVIASVMVQAVSIAVHFKYYWLTLAPIEFRDCFTFKGGPFLGQCEILIAACSRPEYFDFFWIRQFGSHPIMVGIAVGTLFLLLALSVVGLKSKLFLKTSNFQK